MPVLVHRSPPRIGQRFRFERSVVLGRGPLCDVVLPESSVSRRHAQISVADGRCFLADLGSGNGTFLNGKPVAEAEPLSDGDEFRVGVAAFEFHEQDAANFERTRSHKIAIQEKARTSGPLPVVIPLAQLNVAAAATDEIERLRRKLDFFRQAGGVLTKTLEERELFEALLEKAMEAL